MINAYSQKVFIFLSATDMRKSYDTLSSLVVRQGLDPLSGDVFVFTNKNRNRVKILIWEKGGYWLCCKRLECGVFAVPLGNDGCETTLLINQTELRLLIEGIELKQIKRRKRFDLNNNIA